MSQENVDGVLRGYEALNRGDLDAAVAGLAPDCELVLPPILPEAAASYQGREGLRRFWEAWRESFEGFRMEVEEVIDAGDRVLVMAAACGTGADSGADVRTPSFAIIWTIEGGQAVHMHALPTRAEGVEALGLSGG